jgi:hypothetical protein
VIANRLLCNCKELHEVESMAEARKTTAAEERDLIGSAERGEWVSVGDIEVRRAFWREVAKRSAVISPLVGEKAISTS